MKGIITLCGSTKFMQEYNEVNLELSLKDWVILTVGAFTHSDEELLKSDKINEEAKKKFDKLHMEKIGISQAIVVINKNGYIGESTTNELKHALKLGKKIYWYDSSPQNIPDRLYSNEINNWHALLED